MINRCNNHSLKLREVFTPALIDAYVNYLPTLTPKTPYSSPAYLVSLLKLNTVCIQYLGEYLTPYRSTVFSFAWDLYRGTNDLQVAYALLFLCQFVKVYQTDDLVTRLYLNIIHLFNNPYLDIIYRASQILSSRFYSLVFLFLGMLKLDSTTQMKLCKRVHMNLLMNDHIVEQQIHIWKLIIQSPEFFYSYGDPLFFQILSSSKSLVLRSYQHRELLVDIISLVAAYYCRRQRDMTKTGDESQRDVAHPSDERQRFINLHMLITVCRVLQYSVVAPQEQFLFKRGCELVKTILQLTPRQPLSLEELEKPSSQTEKTLQMLADPTSSQSDDQLYRLIMPFIVSFRISAMSLVYFKNEFLEKNAENLQKKICRVLEYVDRSYVFGSMIELLPGMASSVTSFIELFSCPLPYSPTVLKLLNAIRDTLFDIFQKDFKLIPPSNTRRPTRLWRVVYLIKVIVDRTPASLPPFVTTLLQCCEQLHSRYRELAADPRTLPYLNQSDIDTVSSHSRQDYSVELGTPPTPQLRGCELVYAIQLLLELLISNLNQLGDHHTAFLTFIAASFSSFFQGGQRCDLLTFTLQLFTKLLESEEDLLTVREVVLLLSGSREVHMAQESVLYEGLVSAHWKFIFAVCKRFVGMD